MSESQSRTPKGGAKPDFDARAARRKNMGLASFLQTLNLLTKTGPPGETSLLKLVDDEIERTAALDEFRASGEPIQDVEVLVQGGRAMLFQHPSTLSDCLVDVFSPGTALLEVVRIVGGHRRQILLRRRLDEVPAAGLVLKDEYPNKQRLVLEIHRVGELNYRVRVALESSGAINEAARNEPVKPARPRASRASARSRKVIDGIVGGIGAGLRPIHSAVAPVVLIAVIGASPLGRGDGLRIVASSQAREPAAFGVLADVPQAVGPVDAADATWRAAAAAWVNASSRSATAMSAAATAGSRGDTGARAKHGKPDIIPSGGKSANEAAALPPEGGKWGSLVKLRMASVKRLAVRVDGKEEYEELNRDFREALTAVLRENGMAMVVVDGDAKDYDAVLTLRHQTANASSYEASALVATLDDAAAKNLRQYIEDCSSSTGGSRADELRNASAKLADTLITDLKNARNFKEEEKTTSVANSGGL